MTKRFEVDGQESDELSALVDGELDAGAAAQICGRWRDQAKLRERWHRYQLIGDVLRSDDLASTAGHDIQFLEALRNRMASEPIMIAPVETIAAPSALASKSHRGRRRVAAFGAIAAGFMVVAAGALTILGLPVGGDSSPAAAGASLAGSPTAAATVANAPPRADPAGELQPTVASGQLIRDAKLDSYLSAHRQWSSGAMLGGHAAYLRHSPAADGSNR